MTDLQDLYRELILEHNRNPRNHRKLEDADQIGEGFNPLCGDRVTVFLKVESDVVREVTFEGAGCAISTASASMMTQSLKGKTVGEANALFKKFHGLATGKAPEAQEGPTLGKLLVFSGIQQYPARVKCATLAWHTFNAALNKSCELVSTE